ncbi:MAG: acyl-CoA thioesterase, partial [Rhodoglobus sp.]
RTILQLIRSRRRPRLAITDVAHTPFRTLLTDIDVLGHMNNGVYFSIMDLGRMDLMIRSGAWAKLREHGMYPVMVNETISFRKSLNLGQKFVLETRLVGLDVKAIYTEQRFVVDGEIYAKAMTRARFLKKSGGTVTVAELGEVVGADVTDMAPPAWVESWAKDVALPATRDTAPSDWD